MHLEMLLQDEDPKVVKNLASYQYVVKQTDKYNEVLSEYETALERLKTDAHATEGNDGENSTSTVKDMKSRIKSIE